MTCNMKELNFPSQLFYGHPVENHRICYNFDFKLVSVEKSFLRQVMSRTNCTRLRKDNSSAPGQKTRMLENYFHLSIFNIFIFWEKMVQIIQRFVTGHFRRFFQGMQRVFLKNAKHVKPIRIQAVINSFSFWHFMAYEEGN